MQTKYSSFIYSALQPWTPCLPIRGGKLKTSKAFSSSNPQLPFTCTSFSGHLPHCNTSANSINASHIWREASPNNFNLYSASISSLNSSLRSRNSVMDCYGSSRMTNWRTRAASEERPANLLGRGTAETSASPNSGGILLQGPKLKQLKIKKKMSQDSKMLYERKINRSFEQADHTIDHNIGKVENSLLRRSTPHLADDQYLFDETFRNSMVPTLCCANFMKQLRKINQY